MMPKPNGRIVITFDFIFIFSFIEGTNDSERPVHEIIRLLVPLPSLTVRLVTDVPDREVRQIAKSKSRNHKNKYRNGK